MYSVFARISSPFYSEQEVQRLKTLSKQTNKQKFFDDIYQEVELFYIHLNVPPPCRSSWKER